MAGLKLGDDGPGKRKEPLIVEPGVTDCRVNLGGGGAGLLTEGERRTEPLSGLLAVSDTTTESLDCTTLRGGGGGGDLL